MKYRFPYEGTSVLICIYVTNKFDGLVKSLKTLFSCHSGLPRLENLF